MRYYVNVKVEIDKCYIVEADDDYQALSNGEDIAAKEYGNDPDVGAVEAWDATPIGEAVPKMISWMRRYDESIAPQSLTK